MRLGFGGLLSDEQWQRLLQAGTRRGFRGSERIIRQGDEDDTVYLLAHGTVKVSLLRSDGIESLVAVRGPGEALGEMAALSGLPRTVTVSVLTGPCHTRALSGERFRLIVHDMGLDRVLWEHVVRRQQESEAVRTETASLTSRERLGEAMIRLSFPLHGVSAGTPDARELLVTQRELGAAVGRSLSWVQGEIRKLRDEGVIATKRGSIVIHSEERLRKAVESSTNSDNRRIVE